MSATAFKNAVRRREHYERHQPAAREHLGLLEKHKDYAQRAKNYHSKEQRLKELRKKAANRNPDEFYYKMTNTETKGGIHKGTTERPILTGDMLKVLKSQDKSYLQTIKNSEDKKIETLRSTLHLSTVEKNNQHLKFGTDETGTEAMNNTYENGIISDAESVDDDAPLATSGSSSFSGKPQQTTTTIGKKRGRSKEKDNDDDDTANVSGTENIFVSATNTRSRIISSSTTDEPKELSPEEVKQARKQRKKLIKENKKAYIELDQRIKRSAKLGTLIQHMDLHQQLLQKGRRMKVAEADGINPAVYVWKPERKR